MTLKELRISKGLNQGECAAYLGMTTRNYQNYENNPNKSDTARYHAIYQKLEVYGKVRSTVSENICEYHTNVVAGENLQMLIRKVSKYQKRYCFA